MYRNLIFVFTLIIIGSIFGCNAFINPEEASFLQFTPATLDFGNVSAGGSQDESIIITNIGVNSIEINEIVLVAGTDFIILQGGVNVTNPISLNNSETHTVFIRFSPASIGSFIRMISVLIKIGCPIDTIVGPPEPDCEAGHSLGPKYVKPCRTMNRVTCGVRLMGSHDLFARGSVAQNTFMAPSVNLRRS